jgi:RES domain-containing protein
MPSGAAEGGVAAGSGAPGRAPDGPGAAQAGGAPADPPLRPLAWRPSYRIVSSRYPPIDLFERVAPPEDWDALIELESLTNERLRDAADLIRLVPPGERVVGPGAGYVMAAFTHIAPEGGRFNDATFGAYYCARTLDTAVAETCYHRARFLAATEEPPLQLDMRVLEAAVAGELHDLRGQSAAWPGVYDPADYGAGQALARRLRARGSDGVAFDSVRHPGGECVALYRPRLVSGCRQTRTLTYVWDGHGIAGVYEKRPFGGARGRRRSLPAGE